MEVKLLNHTPLEVADIAICKCYSNTPHTEDSKRAKRIETVANQQKHSSVIEHLYYNFDIDGVSRALLQELARHRIASYTVKSTRYTLQELKNVFNKGTFTSEQVLRFCVLPKGYEEDEEEIYYYGNCLSQIADDLLAGIPNDKVKYKLPEAYKTSLVMSINARSLQNFLNLRTDKKALWEIQDLAKAMYEVLPDQHKQLFMGSIK